MKFRKGQLVRIIKAPAHWGKNRQPELNSVLEITYVSDLSLHNNVYFDRALNLISAVEDIELVDLTTLEKVIYGLKID